MGNNRQFDTDWSMVELVAASNRPNSDRGYSLGMTELHMEELEEFTEEYDFSTRAACARYLVQMGMHAMKAKDPRNKSSEQEGENPTPRITDYVPEGKENAIELRGDEDSLVDRIEDDLLEVVQSDPEVVLDGWKVYK